MSAPLSKDLRKRLIANVEAGMGVRAAGRKLDIPPSTAIKLVKKWRLSGDCTPGQHGGHKRSRLEAHADFIEDMVSRNSDWSEPEMAAYLYDECGVEADPTTVGRFIRKKGWRYKKNSNRK